MRLDAIEFDVAVVTNITHEHLDFHGTWENYRDAKALLFRSLANSVRKARTAKVAVLNADDEGSFDYLRGIECEEQIVYGAADSRSLIADGKPIFSIRYQPSAISHSAQGLSFIATTPFGNFSISSSLLGRYNVSNILAAIGVGIARRVPFDAMRAGIANVRGVLGRMEMIQREPFSAIVDFAHTPNALRVALETAREIARGKVIVVFGCAGLRDVEKRALMGEVAGKLADKIIMTAEDPRTESLDAINAQIAQGLERAERKYREDYFVVNDRAEAIAYAVNIARAGDVVIVTGKGHERSMCFGETEFPWSDQDAMRAALQGRR
ncbi:MAG: UDP-N-acetylmuramyl-tripeptide synthetase [Chloroflexi bacterium]|nr:UDP-N-acetylmuramyl-tripeptide synthetase [Chloroflexota bacterium]